MLRPLCPGDVVIVPEHSALHRVHPKFVAEEDKAKRRIRSISLTFEPRLGLVLAVIPHSTPELAHDVFLLLADNNFRWLLTAYTPNLKVVTKVRTST